MTNNSENNRIKNTLSDDRTQIAGNVHIANGIRLGYEIHGNGDIPIVMVHGSWFSRRSWDPIVPSLAESFRVLTYDRRGHGESETPAGQGSVREDVADLADLIEHLDLAPAWVVGQSFGGSITLRLAGERPNLLRGIAIHEPPLFSLVADDSTLAPMLDGFAQLNARVAERIESGDHAGAAEQFVVEGLGPGTWNQFSPAIREMLIGHAPTYLDEANDPDALAFDPSWIREFKRPALLTHGDQSPPLFPSVIRKLAEALPSEDMSTFKGAGHAPHLTQPEAYAETITAFVHKHST